MIGGGASSGGGGGSDFPDPANPPAGISSVAVEHGVRTGNGLITITYTANPTGGRLRLPASGPEPHTTLLDLALAAFH